MLPDIETLHRLLSVDPAAGTLTWKQRSLDEFGGSDAACRSWNKRMAGKPALNSVSNYGYLRGNIFNRGQLAHRVIFAMHFGYWPSEVDHINGSRTDNRIANLREVTRSENTRNKRIPSNNTSGHHGVGWDKQAGKWRAQIKSGGKANTIGLFAEKSEAIAARKDAEVRLKFHPNHGSVV